MTDNLLSTDAETQAAYAELRALRQAHRRDAEHVAQMADTRMQERRQLLTALDALAADCAACRNATGVMSVSTVERHIAALRALVEG